MLYPNFKELLSYQSVSKRIKLNFSGKKNLNFSGNFLSHFKGQGMEFDEVREYVYGDNIKDVEWRSSARSDKTYVKIYREERKRNVVIAVDNNDYMNFGTRKTFKNVVAAHIASILGFAANENKDRLGFYIFGNQKNRFTYFKPTDSKKSLFYGLKILSSVTSEKFENYSIEGAIFNLKRLNANPNILFVISDFRWITDQFEKTLFLLGKKPEIVFINIIDDSDCYIPDVGEFVVEYGNNSYFLNTKNRRAAERYKKIYFEKQKIFRNYTTKLNVKIIDINTKDDPIKILKASLK
jgi:uncharacterized protein (DUF58 family)